MRFTSTRAVAVLLLSSALCGTSVAEQGDPEYATDYLIVKVHPGVEPQPLEGGLMSLRYVEPTDLPPDEVAVTEVLMAALIQVWDVASIEPMIQFPIADAALAAQFGIDRFYIINVPQGTDVAIMAQQLAPFDTHVELASLDWYGQFLGLPPDDPLFTDQWYLHNTEQTLVTDCPVPPGCVCAAGSPPGTADADIDALEAWTLETGSSNVVVAVLDTGADLGHPDLMNKLVPGQNFVRGEDPNDPSETGGFSHGTGVAGVVAAEANNAEGVAGVS